jgi:peptide/nickel transport system substrate-binding protein
VRRHVQAMAVFMAAFSLLLTACTGGSSNPTPSESAGPVQRGGNLRFAQVTQAPSLNPTTSFLSEAIWAELLIFDRLYIPSADGKSLVPSLAESYDVSSDNLTWTFHLRSGVKFSNGQPLTADDVAFSLEQNRASNAWGFINAEWESIEAPDASTVVIQTRKPWAPLLADLALFANAVYPADYAGESKDEFFHDHPIGSGPFMLSKWVKGDYLEFKRNPYYWQEGKPYLDTITFQNVPDQNTRILQLKGGQTDLIASPAWSTVSDLQSTPGVQAGIYPSNKTDLLYLNTERAPFQDPSVRQAIAYAIDREAIIKAILFGHGEPANSFIAPSIPYYSEGNPGPLYDVEKAKQLMAQSSFPNGFSTSLLVITGPVPTTVGQVIQDNLKAIGIDVKIVAQDQNAAFANLSSHNYDMMQWDWTSDIPDPDELVGGYVDTDGQWTSLVNPKTRVWNSAAEQSFDTTQRASLYEKIQAQVAVDSSVIALFYSPYLYAYSDKVHGFTVYPTGYFPLEEVWLSQ